MSEIKHLPIKIAQTMKIRRRLVCIVQNSFGKSAAFKMNLVESLDQLSSASAKKAKKAKKQHFNDGMIDAGDREAKKPFHSSTGLAVAVMYNVLIFAYAWYTKNYLVMMLVIAIWMVWNLWLQTSNEASRISGGDFNDTNYGLINNNFIRFFIESLTWKPRHVWHLMFSWTWR